MTDPLQIEAKLALQRQRTRECRARAKAKDPAGYLAAQCAAMKKWYAKNKKRAREIQLRAMAKKPVYYKAMGKARYQRARLREFGMTKQDYDLLLEKQEGRCAICRAEHNDSRNLSKDSFAIDHDHSTGKVRGLLCFRCNTSIGGMRDDAALLRSAADYIERAAGAGDH